MKHLPLITAFILLGASCASAQEKPFNCLDFNGKTVENVEAEGMRALNRAAIRLEDQSPVVLTNGEILSWIKEETRLYFFAHECAHHALGHTIGEDYDLALEREADCWAARKLVEGGFLDDEQVRLVQRDIYTFDVAEWRIAPGPFRQIGIMACVKTKQE